MDLVDRLASTRIGATYDQYARSELRRGRLRAHLERGAWIVLVGEAAGYRGARVSGVPFASERHSNRRPTRAEVEASRPFPDALTRGREVVAVGRLAAHVLGAQYVRHPPHGGSRAFEAGLRRRLAG